MCIEKVDVNKVVLIGSLDDNPEITETQNQNKLCTLFVLTTEAFGEKGKVVKNRIRVIAWNKLAEVCIEKYSKGDRLEIRARLQNRTVFDSDQNKRILNEVVAQSVWKENENGRPASENW